MKRFRGASKAPLAIAGILAAPLFIVALMAFSLKFDKPQGHIAQLAEPTKDTVLTIYLATFAVVGALILVGLLSMLWRSRLAVIVPSVAGVVATIALLIPLGTWAAEHIARYPLGIDNLHTSSRYEKWLRGEWEHDAQTTAHQLGWATIGIAVAAIVITVALEWRGRGPVIDEPGEGVYPEAAMPRHPGTPL